MPAEHRFPSFLVGQTPLTLTTRAPGEPSIGARQSEDRAPSTAHQGGFTGITHILRVYQDSIRIILGF